MEELYRIYNGKWSKELLMKDKYERIRKKIVDTFSNLEFIEGPHKYFLHKEDGTKVEMPCVSNVTHLFKPHFDSEEQAERCSQKYYDNPESKYYQMTKDEILELWNKISTDACNHGSERHEYSESLFYYMTYQYDKILPEFKDRLKKDENGVLYFSAVYPKEVSAAKFYNDIPVCIVPILAETKVYICNEYYRYSGTFDILFYYDQELDERNTDKTKDLSGLMVFDWKTNKDLYKNFSSYLLYDFSEMLDMPLSIYKLQLSAYQNCLENIGEKVVGRRIIWLKPDSNYEKIPLENVVKRLHNALIAHFDLSKLL